MSDLTHWPVQRVLVAEAAQQFEAAVHSLIGMRSAVFDSGVAVGPSLYSQMRSSIAAQQGTSVGGAARSLPPVWIDGLAWLREVDAAVAGWVADGRVGDTPQTLDWLARWPWRGDDCDLLLSWSLALAAFVGRAEALLDARRVFQVKGPCPACEATSVSRERDGEVVRAPALSVSMQGAWCGACAEHWSPEDLTTLAAALGAPLLAGVTA